jgi:hypothetical protein
VLSRAENKFQKNSTNSTRWLTGIVLSQNTLVFHSFYNVDLYSEESFVSWSNGMSLQEKGFCVINDSQRKGQEDDVKYFVQNVKFYSDMAY